MLINMQLSVCKSVPPSPIKSKMLHDTLITLARLVGEANKLSGNLMTNLVECWIQITHISMGCLCDGLCPHWGPHKLEFTLTSPNKIVNYSKNLLLKEQKNKSNL